MKIVHLIFVLASGLWGCGSTASVEVMPNAIESIHQNIRFDESERHVFEYSIICTFPLSARGQSFGFEEVNESVKFISPSAEILMDSKRVPLERFVQMNTQHELDGSRFKTSKLRFTLPENYAGQRVHIRFAVALNRPTKTVYVVLTATGGLLVDYTRPPRIGRMTATIATPGNGFTIQPFGYRETGITIQDGYRVVQFEATNPNTPMQTVDTRPALVVSNMTSWKDYTQDLARLYREALEESTEIDFQVLFPESNQDDFERAKTVAAQAYRWVTKNHRYAAQGFSLTHARNPYGVSEIARRRSGDCKDLSLLYMAALKKYGILSEPVEVQLSSARLIFPNELFHRSNHVIVYVPMLNRHVDLTGGEEELMGNSVSHYHGAKGLHLFSGEIRRINAETPAERVYTKTVLKRDGLFWLGETEWRVQGQGAIFANRLLNSRILANGEAQKKYFDRLSAESIDGGAEKKTDEFEGLVSARYRFRLRDTATNLSQWMAAPPSALAVHPMYLPALREIGPYCDGKKMFHDEVVLEDDTPGEIRIDNASINSREATFSQIVSRMKDSIRVVRTLTFNYPSHFCDSVQLMNRAAFFQQVDRKIKFASDSK